MKKNIKNQRSLFEIVWMQFKKMYSKLGFVCYKHTFCYPVNVELFENIDTHTFQQHLKMCQRGALCNGSAESIQAVLF